MKKNKVLLISKDKTYDRILLKNELKAIIYQQPNTKLLGLFKYKLWIYNKTGGKSKKGKKLGESPVIYDSTYTIQTLNQFNNYLFNKGFFNPTISYKTTFHRKKAIIYYYVNPGKSYFLNNLTYLSNNSRILNIVMANLSKSLLKKGDQYDVSKVINERSRIINDLLNEGYYNFDQNNILFEVDTNIGNNLLNITLQINTDSSVKSGGIYYINNIYIHTDYDIKGDINTDTTLIKKGYYIIGEKNKYNLEVLLDDVLIKPGELFNNNKYKSTGSRLTELPVFRFVNIQFTEISDSINKIDPHVYLIPTKKRGILLELEASNSESTDGNLTSTGALSTALKGTYISRNLFKQLGLFKINAKGGIQTQFNTGSSSIYSSELSLRTDFYFPKFLLPFRLNKLSQNFNPSTNISASYSFYTRSEFYTLNTTSFSFSYDWKESKYKRHILSPSLLTFTKLSNATLQFEEILGNNRLLRNSFDNQLILGIGYTFLYANMSSAKNQLRFKTDIELAGNTLRLFSNLLYQPADPNTKYTFFNLAFSQYTRIASDLRYYKSIRSTTLTSRISGGIGIPYGNANILPYVKQFYAGGPTSLRAWRIRSIGPGSYEDITQNIFPDQTGDILLEGNIEYRVPITNVIKGAIFIDAGNVWTIKEDDSRPGSQFKADKFLGQIAIGGGLGIRLDFSFFLLRLDMGIPLKDPAKPEGERWNLSNINIIKDPIYNLAIGYPF